MVDAGHEFYLQAEVTNPDKLMVRLSKTYFVEMNQQECFDFLDRKEPLLTH